MASAKVVRISAVAAAALMALLAAAWLDAGREDVRTIVQPVALPGPTR